jgi:hypothetical protein
MKASGSCKIQDIVFFDWKNGIEELWRDVGFLIGKFDVPPGQPGKCPGQSQRRDYCP